MNGRRGTPRGGAVALVVWTMLAFAPTAGSAPADSATRRDTTGPYSLALRALTGPQGADLMITLTAAPDAAPVETLKKVQIKVFGAGGDAVVAVQNPENVALENGSADFDLGQVPRGRRIEAKVLVQTSEDLPTYVVKGEATTRLRPDLVVTAVYAPPQTTTSRPIDVTADVAEINGETGATAKATLMLGPTQLADPVPISIDAGGHASVTFNGVKMPNPVPSEVSVFVSDADPAETDDTNNARTRTIDVTENELTSNVLLPDLGGYGVQFGDHVYAPISGPPANVTDMEAKAKALEPQLVRIFYNDNWDENADGTHAADWQQNLDSFYKVIGLAQETGATINISFQNLSHALVTPAASMHRFADVLQHAVRDLGYTNVRWASVGNEVNRGAARPATWAPIFLALDAELTARGLRDQIHLVGPDLLENDTGGDHRTWIQYVANPDNHIVEHIDAWSEHIYWIYNTELQKMERRLKDVRQLFMSELPESARKPTYLWEFGVRGIDPNLAKPTPRYAYYEDGNPIREQNVSAFQSFWFFLESAQLAFTGVSKWDAYWAMYDKSSANNQWNWTIGPPSEGWPLYPMWYATHLLYATTEPGWQVVRVDPWQDDDWREYDDAGNRIWDDQEKELVAYAGPDRQLTLIGLDSHGRLLNTASDESPAYSIGGLPANTTFNLAVWNATGDGKNVIEAPVTTNAIGVARFTVPLQAAFALTTVPVA
jgi:hypothetical protein